MSTYWGYNCTEDLAVATPFRNTPEAAQALLDNWELWLRLEGSALAEYGELSLSMHSSPGGTAEAVDFLREHYKHGVEIVNEYGVRWASILPDYADVIRTIQPVPPANE